MKLTLNLKSLTAVFLLLGSGIFAQTGIGTSTPDASAKLDVSATNKGFLPPRVSLISLTDVVTIPNPASGLLVYCKGDAGLAAGYYFWNGSSWAAMVTSEVGGSLKASTLNLSNTSATTPSITLNNGDSALGFSNSAQLKFGWSGSDPGTSQFAQFIHTRHNSAVPNNAIDFYLSNGTANNTITSGSTLAMSITSPNHVEIKGKLNVADPTGNVATKVAGNVDAGVPLIFDNLKVQVTTAAPRGLQIGAVAGTITVYIQGFYVNGIGSYSGSKNGFPVTLDTNYTSSLFGWNFTIEGDTAIYHIADIPNGRFYRVTLMIGYGFYKNFITIERLM